MHCNKTKKQLLRGIIFSAGIALSLSISAAPTITGAPVIDTPPLLDWSKDFEPENPDLFEPSANRIFDLHANMDNCGFTLSTAGNYHMALSELWYNHFLPVSPEVKNWMYTTSPPVSVPQAKNSVLTIGNWKGNCKPDVAVGPKKLIAALQEAGVTEGEPIPVIVNQGNVILVKKGNPKNIRTIWDLGKKRIKVVTSNPYTEPGSFGNYSNSIYNIAANDRNPPRRMTAEKLFDKIFNGDNGKWLAGARIHHREVPWSVAHGKADAGLMFYHLALYTKRSFPDLFDIVPLGGTVENPDAVAGNKIGKMFIVRIKGEWDATHRKARERLIKMYQSPEFAEILQKHGLQTP